MQGWNEWLNGSDLSDVKTDHKWREATSEDLPCIEKLVTEETRDFFGYVNLAALVDQSLHAVVIENVNNKISGFICLNNYPNISALLPEIWTDWMQYHYELNEVQSHNTLFVHYIAWSHILHPDHLKICLHDLFLNTLKLEYVCLVTPPNEAGYNSSNITGVIEILIPRGQYVRSALPIVLPRKSAPFFFIKHHNIKKLLYGPGIDYTMVADNDDLVEILDATAPKLRNLYGDYYIAEIVSKNEPNRSIFVAEIDNHTVAMVCFNTNVDLEKLNHNFELTPFHALRKQNFTAGFDKIQVRGIIARESLSFFHGTQPVSFGEESYTSLFSPFNIRYLSRSDSVSTYGGNVQLEKRILGQLEVQSLQTTQIAKEFEREIMKELEQELKKFEQRNEYYDEYIREVNLPLSEENVIAIELLGMKPSTDERMLIDLLKAAFTTHDDKAYILLTTPTTSYLPKFLSYFTKAIPRPVCSFPDNVYLIHKNSLYGSFSVSFMEENHWAQIQSFIDYKGSKEIMPAEQIMKMCEDFIINPKSEFSVLLVHSEDTIVGVIILKPATSMDGIRQSYCVDSYENVDAIYSPSNFGQIIYCYMTPLLLSYSKFIFQEIFRLTSYTSIYYSIKKETQYLDFFNSLLPIMFPMKPRRRMSLPDITSFEDIEPNERAYQRIETSAIYYTNVRLCALQRKQIDSRIVVIGFGQTSKTFLETLIYRQESQHLRFTNITCICPAGILEADMTYPGSASKLFAPHKLFYSSYLRQLEMRVWVNFVPGYMTKIDRENKFVILDKNEQVPYDKLFLFCGVQFDVPVQVYNQKTPSNLVLVNKLLHGKMIHYRIKNIVKNAGCNLIVYGSVAKAYAGVNYLLTSGIKRENIHFVIPPIENLDDLNLKAFDDEFVEAVVHRELEKAGVNVYQNFKFVTWSVDEEINMINNITFESHFECITIPCVLFISYFRKVANRLTVKAVNRSGLVFDGRIVIDAYCRTNDPNIYAAGPLTKYRRILYADRFRHIYYNSKEIGIKLALKLVENYSQIDVDEERTESPLNWIVPHYKFPLVESILLPGNYFYINIHQPGFQLPNYLTRLLDSYGTDLVTGGSLESRKASDFSESNLNENRNHDVEEKLIAERGYFHIYLDKHGFVKNIVCLSKKPFNGQNLVRLYGLHEKLLNNLKYRYECGEITDFFEFFNERWAHFLNHDRFYKLLEMNEKIYRYNLDGNTQWLTEYLERETNGYKRELPESKRQALIRYYQSNEFRKEIERNLLKLIDEYKDILFMYATPEILSNG